MVLPIEIKVLNRDHAQAIARLHHETFVDTYIGKMPAAKIEEAARPEFVDSWRLRIQNMPLQSVLYGAFIGKELAGFAGAGLPRERWGYQSEIYSINIPARFQKRGLGRKLVLACAEFCLNLPAENLYLYCMTSNSNAVAFYRHLGGQLSARVAERDGYQDQAFVWNDLAQWIKDLSGVEAT